MTTTLHELKQRAKLGAKNQYKVDLCIDLDKLEIRPCKLKHPSWGRNSPYFCLVKDKRSFQDKEGFWHVYPIALSRNRVWIVCPLCECIHIHGNDPKYGYADNEYIKIAHCSSEWREKLYGKDEHNGYTENGCSRAGYFIEKLQ